MARLLETDSNTNINISSATAIGAYTATKTRLVHVRVAVDQAAGAGDYVIYATLQIAGAGSSYVIIPKTTATAASGETALMFVSGPIPMDNADVLTVYLDGLAGDTTTPDTRVDFYEMDYLRPTVAGRTLTVAATGEASANVTYSAGVALGGPLAEASDLPSVAGLALEATAQAILEDTGTTLPAAIAGIGAGGGLYSETITIKDTLDNPLDGVLVHVATDSAFANIVRSGYTNNMGQVALNFDTTGTYYGRAEIAGYGISVFDVEVTA